MAADDTNFNITANVTQALEAIESVNKKLTQFGNNIATEFNKIPQAAQLASAAFLALGASVASFADKIVNTANATEDSIGSVLAFTQALGQNGGKIDQTARIMERFAVTIEGINKGNTGAYHAIKSLGVTFEELGTMSQQALRDKVLKSLSEIEDPLRRNALAAQFFGRTFANVDIKKFYEDEMKSRQEMERFAPAVQSANDAFDNMKRILMSIQLAFAQAFKPIFDIIKQINPNIDTMTATLKAIGLALVFMGSAAVIRGLLVLRDTLVAITIAARANPFVAIASALIAAGYAVAEYTDLLKSSDDQAKENGKTQDKNSDKTDKAKRDQTGLLDVMARQTREIQMAGKELEKNFANATRKYQLELDDLNRSENQIKLAEEQNKIEQEGQNALFQLRQRFNALDTVSRGEQSKAFKAEEAAIIANTEAQKKKADDFITQIQRQKASIEDLSKSLGVWNGAVTNILQNELKLTTLTEADTAKRLTLENQVNAVMMERQLIIQKISKLGPDDQLKVSQALDKTTASMGDLIGKTDDLQFSFNDAFSAQLRNAGASKEAIRSVITDLAAQRQSISETSEILLHSNKEILEASRSWQTGWNTAFNKYVNDATNAAQAATKIFDDATKGMEDSIVEFAKTGKLSFDNLLQTIAEDILRSQIRQLFAQLMSPIGGGSAGTGTGGGLIGGFGKLLGFADGGTIGTNAPVVVGERGPEIISGAAGKTVTPNSGMGANVTYNINAVDARSFQQMVAADPSFIYAVTLRGQNMVPGGGFR